MPKYPQPLEFEAWCDEIDRLCLEIAGISDYTKLSGRDCWKDYYESGETPDGALHEDMSYWDG